MLKYSRINFVDDEGKVVATVPAQAVLNLLYCGMAVGLFMFACSLVLWVLL